MKDFSRDQLLQQILILKELRKREQRTKLYRMFPDEGPLRRELYPKHLEFFRAGKKHREKLMMAANRIGKTEAGGYELACHLTGWYPDWWEGRTWDRSVGALVAGDTAQSTRDILQTKLLGGLWDSDTWGTGIIPHDSLQFRPAIKAGVPNAYEEVRVRHRSGTDSILKFRSYDQGRRIFQGFELDIFWPDEEIPEDVYAEGLMRTMTTEGMVMMTFTPLNGLTPLVLSYLESMGSQVPV